MFVEIIPYDASLDTEALTYKVGASFRSIIKSGQLVKIPYGKKEIFGIVAHVLQELGLDKDFKTEIKEILEIINEKPLLAPYQITIIERISLKYILPIHRVCNIFLPTLILRRLEKKSFPLDVMEQIKNGILGENQEEFLQNNKKNIFSQNIGQQKPQKENGIFLSQHTTLEPESFLPFLRDNIVIIVPDDIFLERMQNFFVQKYNENEILFLSSDATEATRGNAWIDIYNKKYKIIIGTRRILYYNLENYDEIWYLEDSFSTDYYHYPIRIQYQDIFAHIVDSNHFSLKIFTSIPQLSTLAQFHFFPIYHI